MTADAYETVRLKVLAEDGVDPGQVRTLVDFAVNANMGELSRSMLHGDPMDMGLVTQEVCRAFGEFYQGTGKIQKALAYICKKVRMDVVQDTDRFTLRMAQGDARYASLKDFLANLDDYIDSLKGADDEQKP